ncbi:MAG: glycosyltransferase family 4 protein [Fusobacteriaceae bacterium]
MKKIGLYWDNTRTKDVDCSNIENGNPGLGGSVYLFIMLAYHLQRKYSKELEIIFFCQFPENLPKIFKKVKVINFDDLISKSIEENLEVLILDSNKTSLKEYDELNQKNIKIISWGHCFGSLRLLKKIQNSPNVKKYICVGKEQLEQLIDMNIYEKSDYIYNLFDSELYSQNINLNKKENIVTYMGAIEPFKGFHILAKQWKQILKEVPDAKFYVIGSGKLYDRNAKLGKFGIAQESYEKSFINYLLNEKGELLDSVTFFGHLGMEKNELISKTKIGISNPSGVSETFGITAVEFQASGVPVVTKKCHGYLDTVKDNYTGLLYENNDELAEKIIELLKNEDKYEVFRKNTVEFVKEKFDLDKTLEKWKKCIDNLDSAEKLEKEEIINLDFDKKSLRIKNKKIKKYLPVIPSVLRLQFLFSIPFKIKNRICKSGS